MQTRKYPRTLGEAFKGPDYACSIERPPRGYGAAWWTCMGVLAVCAMVLVWCTR